MPSRKQFPWFLFQHQEQKKTVPEISVHGEGNETTNTVHENNLPKLNYWNNIAHDLRFIDDSARTSLASESGASAGRPRRYSGRSVSTGEPKSPRLLISEHSINSKGSSLQTLSANGGCETPVFDEEKPPQYNSFPHLCETTSFPTNKQPNLDNNNGDSNSADIEQRVRRVQLQTYGKKLDDETIHALNRPSYYPHGVEQDFRYYFQHPYSRLFIIYFVIFCNFLLFAEDPVSHSRMESEIPVFGNVFSFVVTKYPPQWYWRMIKVLMWLLAMFLGLVIGKQVIHKLIFARLFRLKMFFDEQGSWMIMFLTVIIALYIFSHIYNTVLILFHPNNCLYQITALMGITNSSFMKAAACGTWLGDFITAWMVTDMMLQDNMYPTWVPKIRTFWRTGNTRIVTFWGGALGISVLVITLIVSDLINWDLLNRDFVATTELSRAFLASFILVMDLLIVVQDWDFPHFTSDLDINLPGMKIKGLQLNLCRCISLKPYWRIQITGKWFNYGIILMVMILDLNMWKNQIFYVPEDYGQYVGPDNKVYTVSDPEVLNTGNETLWTFYWRSSIISSMTNLSLREMDMKMNSKFLGYPLEQKCTAFIPSIIGFFLFILLIILYGRFPEKPIGLQLLSDRLRKHKKHYRSSWKRDRDSLPTPKSSTETSQLATTPQHLVLLQVVKNTAKGAEVAETSV